MVKVRNKNLFSGHSELSVFPNPVNKPGNACGIHLCSAVRNPEIFGFGEVDLILTHQLTFDNTFVPFAEVLPGQCQPARLVGIIGDGNEFYGISVMGFHGVVVKQVHAKPIGERQVGKVIRHPQELLPGFG